MKIILCYFIAFIIEALIMKQYCSALFVSKYSKIIQWFSVFTLYAVLFGVSFFESFIINTVAFLSINFIYIFFFYKTNWLTAFFHSIIATTIMCLSELVTVGFVSHLAKDFYTSPDYFKHLLTMLLFAKQLYFWIVFLISHLFPHPTEQQHGSVKGSLLLTVIPAITLYIFLTFLAICYYVHIPDTLSRMIAISALLLLLANLTIWGIYIHSTEKNREFTELQLQLQKENDAVSYYQMLLSQNEAQNVLIHDIKKHLQAIALLNQQNDPEKIASYIDNLVSSSDLQTGIRMSDNEFFNAILCRYKHYCTEHQIVFHTDIRSGTVNFIAENDLTSLFCNLLDNAVESAVKQPDSLIELHVAFKSEANLTVITVINSCHINPFRKSDGKLPSTKKDSMRHGFGLKSMNRIIQRYHGNMELYYDEEERLFHTIITLKKPV